MKKIIVLTILTIFCVGFGLSSAQEELPPPPDASSPAPPDAPPPARSAAPAPQMDANAPMADKQLEVFAPSEGASDVPVEVPGVESHAASKKTAASQAPEIYNVQGGDTLWDICQKMLDNPWYWPKLWSLNEYIANPHIIQPGNKVAFYPGSQTTLPRMDVVRDGAVPPVAAPKAEVAAKVSAAPTVVGSGYVADENLRSIKLKSISVVSEKQIKDAGYISHSGEAKTELSAGDIVYLHFKNPKSVTVGDRFHSIRVIKKVDDPKRFFGKLGYLVKRTAVIQVTAIHKNTIEGSIVDNDDSVTRDEKIIPYQSPVRTVMPHGIEKKINGTIVEAENQMYMVSNNDFVYVNVGRKQGVDDGTQLVVVRKGDGVFPGDDEDLPDVVVGKLLIVETGEKVSTAYVMDLKDALQVGDRVRERAD